MREDVPVDHPNFGRALPCECKERELAEGRIDRFQRYSNLGGLTRLTFDNLSPYGNDPSPANRDRFNNAFAIAKVYAEEPAGWLVLLGHSGSGKTHLAAAIANHLLEKGLLVFFAVVPDLLDHLRSTFGPNSDVTYDELFEKVRNVTVLVLDDLDTQGSTPWAQEKLYQILNHRFNTQLPTVVTSRVILEEMEERIRTRLTDPVVSRVCYLAESGPELPSYFGALDLKLLSGMTFESFDRSGLSRDAEERASLRNAYRLAEGFAKQPEGWLVLQGNHGCGKTHLAAAIANYQRQAGRKVLFCPIADLLDYLRFTFNPDSKVSFDSLFEQVKTVPLLVLDDLVPQTGSAWANEKLFQIINYRYNAQLP
ncbi:MAG: ATP-binding protein, partial [Chloroflexi bacterium]|nr:ATP-binding protein [Chloroflexota bacterium]